MTVSLLHSVAADGSFSAAGAAAWDAQHVLTQATDRLLGRTTAGVGATEEITVGAGLTLSGGTLVNAGATSPIGGSDTQVQFNDGGVFAGNANFTFNKTTNQIAIGAGTAAAPTLIPTGDTNTGMWFPAADTVAWSTGGTERLRLASGGTVSTTGTLSVASGAGTLSDIQILWTSAVAFYPQINLINTNNGVTGPIWTTDKTRGGTTPATAGDQLGQFLFRSYNSSGVFSNAAQMQAISEGVTATGHAGAIRWVTRSTSDVFSERMRIDGTGNVGIGTTSPTTLLSVNGIASFGAGTAALPSVAAFGDLDTGMWFPAANTLAWSTGGAERVRITSAGRVGIGTSSPAELLEIREGNFRVIKTSGIPSFALISSQASGYNPAFAQFTRTGAGATATPDNSSIGELRFDGRDASGGYAAFAIIQANIRVNAAGGAPGYLAFYTSPSGGAAAERLGIDGTGNVGIGTSTFGTSAARAFAIATGTAPTTGPADTIQIYSTDLSAGNTMLSLYTEGTVVNANIVANTTHRIAIRVNGTVYYLLANTAA